MDKKTLILLLIFLQFFVHVPLVRAEYESIYHYYIEEGLEAFNNEDFENAIFYFKTAHAIDPQRQQALQYLNLVKREREGRLHGQSSKTLVASASHSTKENSQENLAKSVAGVSSTTTSSTTASETVRVTPKQEEISGDRKVTYINELDEQYTSRENIKNAAIPDPKSWVDASKSSTEPPPVAPFRPTAPLEPQKEHSYTIVESSSSVRHFADNEELRLNDNLWSQQSTLTIEIEIGKSVQFVGKNITRYLATMEDLLEVSRLDKDRLRVKAVRRGTTIFYVWDDRGRWSFNIRCAYPFENVDSKQTKINQELAAPFKLSHSNNWSTLHRGPKLGDMTRQNLVFTNWLGVDGPTPYGDFDASINTYKFPQSTEIVGQRIGLTNGNIGPFKDFTLRGYDVFKDLSSLTLPGRYFRGALIDSYAFQHKLAYTYFRGQDQTVSIFSSTGNLEEKQSFVEGFKLVLNPDEQTGQYAFNYARGYGSARQPDFKDEVYSVETKQMFKEFQIYGELGYDKDEFATLIRGERDRPDLDINFSVRDINPGYQTIYGQPTNSGQVGASMSVIVKPREFNWDTFIDLYRDRIQPNIDDSNLVNIDLSTAYSKLIDDSSSWGASFGYVNTQQTLSPRQFAQMGSSYSKNIKVGGLRYLSLSLAQTLQWSRYKDSPTSDYDRFGLRAGLRYKLFKYLFYNMTYEYIVVKDIANSDWSTPTAIQTGLNYSAPLTDRLALDLDLTYRKEQQAESNFSFLAGEDSLSNTLSFTYTPMRDVSIFMDSQLRHVWPQNVAQTPEYYDWNFTLGMRSAWNLPFRWNPTGEVQGVVYKDYNGNSLQDKEEPGMAGIKVIAGKYETITNENGEYTLKIHAKKAAVSLDLKTIPQGFVFSTALSRDVNIEHNKGVLVNFGLTSRSGIYGVAFLDVNGNGKPDRGDKFVSNIVVRLDSGDITKTDFSGSYFFENITPGKHKIRIDVSSISLNYFPTVKIDTEVVLEEGMTYVHNIPLKENPAAPKP